MKDCYKFLFGVKISGPESSKELKAIFKRKSKVSKVG